MTKQNELVYCAATSGSAYSEAKKVDAIDLTESQRRREINEI